MKVQLHFLRFGEAAGSDLLLFPQMTEIDIDVGFTEMQGLVYVCTNTMSKL